MKLQIVTGSTLYESAENVLKGFDPNDFFTQYFVVVPDRFTLQAEKLLFKVLNIQSTFNINIVGLSNLANKVVKEEGLNQLSDLDGVLLIQKIFEEEKENFEYFTKGNSALYQEIYKTIQQMKSSSVKADQISDKTRSTNLTKKIRDIRLIYKKYELSKQDSLDADDVIEFFADKIVEKNLYKGAVFAFVGFDSFTSANYMVLEALTKTAKEIRFAVSKPLSPANAFIYEGDILNKLKKLANENKICIDVISPENSMSQNRQAIVKNLFANEITSIENNDYLYVTNSPSIKDEVLFVAKSIKKALYEGARFRDFAILCPRLEDYQSEIDICFSRFGIVKYIDTSAKLSDTLLARFLKKCFALATKGFLKEDILYFLSSEILRFEDRQGIIAFVNEKHISGREKFEYFVAKQSEIFSKVLSLKDNATFQEYTQFISEIIFLVEENLSQYIQRQIDFGFIQEASFEEQAKEAMKDVCIAFQNFHDDVDLDDFLNMFLTALDSKEISSLPSFCDQVFVGESAKSFFSKVQYLFVLGANAGQLPQNSNDDGLFTDGEIESSCFYKILEPTIKMVNKRNRFKLFSALGQAETRLILSFLTFNEEGQKQERAYFVSNLMSIFNIKANSIIQTNNLSSNTTDELLLKLGNKIEAKKLVGELSEEKSKYLGSVRSVLDYQEEEHVDREILSKDLASKIFFKDGKAKVTQIEKFYDCPFKHFVENGLKPIEKKFAEIKPNTYGTIMHNILEDFVKAYVFKMRELKDENIEMFVKDNIENYLDENLVDFLPDKAMFLSEITANAVKLCKRAVYECQNSKFVPTYFEKKFDGNNLTIDGLNIVGVVDRVDIYDDVFRVIDYKTGKITSALISSLYYGKKLQLFLYGNSLRKQLGLEFAGAFYFDAKVSYSKNEKTILKGVFKPKEKIFFALDKRLEDNEFKTSDIVKLGKVSYGFSKEATSQPELPILENYALKISEKAIRHMKNGFIKACPNVESCTYCSYRGICLYEKESGFRALKNMDKFFKDKGGEHE